MDNSIPSLFGVNHTKERQIESWNKVTNEQRNRVLGAIKAHLLMAHPNGMTSRELWMATGIDRTSITGRLREFEKLFDTQLSKYDRDTKKTVTAYRLKELVETT